MEKEEVRAPADGRGSGWLVAFLLAPPGDMGRTIAAVSHGLHDVVVT